MTNQTIYLVWLHQEHVSHEQGIITADEKQSFIEAKAKQWHDLPNPIHAYGVLSKNKNYGHVCSQTGKELTRYWFEPIVINGHLESS